MARSFSGFMLLEFGDLCRFARLEERGGAMTNILPATTYNLLDLGGKMKAGLALLGAGLGITDLTPAMVTAQMSAVESTDQIFNQKRSLRRDAGTALRSADTAGEALLLKAISVLKPHFGQQWNSKWIPAGFTGNSIAVPSTITSRTGLLKSFAKVFTANPTWEVSTADVQVTAALLASAQGFGDGGEQSEYRADGGGRREEGAGYGG